MTVAQLVEALMALPQDLPVSLIVSEQDDIGAYHYAVAQLSEYYIDDSDESAQVVNLVGASS